MCRLFAALSADPLDLAPHLHGSPTSLLAQSTARRGRVQGDGWGVGWFGPGGRPRVVRSVRPVFREKGRLAAAAAGVRGPAAVAHIRAASNPMGLPRRALLRPENQQPFAHGAWLFAHNGILNLPDSLAERLGPHRGDLRGTNDSEVYFWLLVEALERSRSAREAFRAVRRRILADWDAAPRARRLRAKRPYVGLNCVLADGERLLALCLYDGYRARRPDRWLCPVRPARPLFEMAFRPGEGGRSLVAASERTEPGGEWLPLRDGNLLEARLARGRVRWRVAPL